MKKQIIKKVLASLLIVVLLFSVAPISGIVELDLFNTAAGAAEILQKGACGEKMNFVLYDDGKLVISGSGEMYAYGSSGPDVPLRDNGYIKSIIIEEGVTSIDDMAFDGCYNLESVKLPNSMEYIAQRAFRGCTKLTDVKLPDNLLLIEFGAFKNCEKLQTITLPDSLVVIEEEAFAYCKALTKIAFPESLLVIGSGAFKCCPRLTRVTFSEGLLSIENGAFMDCPSFEKINLPKSLVQIGNSAFYKSGYYNEPENWENGLLYSGSLLIDVDKQIKECTVKGDTTLMAYSVFSYCEQLETVTIEEGVTEISSSAFYRCKALKNISFPNSLLVIGDGAFEECTALIDIKLPETIAVIGEKAFNHTGYGYRNYTSDSYLYLGNYLLDSDDYPYNDSYEIKEGTTLIADGAFRMCQNLKEVTIPDSVKIIGANAFANCTYLETVNMGNSVKIIGDCAFINCSRLKSIALPSSVTYIGDKAFGYFSGKDDTFDKNEYFDLIKCYKGSLAEKYAEVNEIKCEIIEVVLGDINNDGSINSADALTVLQAVVGSIVLTDNEKESADVDKSGSIDSSDALLILQYSVGQITKF